MPTNQNKQGDPDTSKSKQENQTPSAQEGGVDFAAGRVADAAGSAASRGKEAMADAGEALRDAGRTAKERASVIGEQAYAAGAVTTRVVGRELSERPWTIVISAATVAGILGFLIGSRR
jgi:ElaB/YqjD/DUF883 family membrane-anchored ribosome-binding protein